MREVENISSQRRQGRKKGKARKKKQTKELVKTWREKAGKRPQEAAMAAVVPQSSKNKKKQSGSHKHKLSFLKKRRKKDAKRAEKARQAKAAEESEEDQKAWCGVTARVVGETAPGSLQGAVVVVQKGRGSQALCLCPNTSQQWIAKADLEYPVNDQVARQAMAPVQLREAARKAVEADEKIQVEQYQLGQLLADHQLKAAWTEVQLRLQPDSAVKFVTPAESEVAASQGVPCQAMTDWQAENRSLLLVPVHSTQPQHWTLLSFSKSDSSADSQPVIRYFDSLASQPATATAKASQLLQLVLQQPEAVLPKPCNRGRQTDGYSCGFWALQYMEREARQFLGCSLGAWQTVGDQSVKLQTWQEQLQKAKSVRETAKKLSEAKWKQLEAPPPLPPPDSAPPDEPDAAKSGAQSSQSKKPAFDSQYGCSRCKYLKVGCLSCNPAKMLRWANKQAGQAGQAAQLETSQPPADLEGEAEKAQEEKTEKAEKDGVKEKTAKKAKVDKADKEKKEPKKAKKEKADKTGKHGKK